MNLYVFGKSDKHSPTTRTPERFHNNPFRPRNTNEWSRIDEKRQGAAARIIKMMMPKPKHPYWKTFPEKRKDICQIRFIPSYS